MTDDSVDRQDMEQELRALAEDGQVTCARALEFARSNKVPPAEVGTQLTGLGLKIVDCQLGCFGQHRADRLSK